MSFLEPWWLVLLVGVAALAAAYLLAQRRRGRYAVRFAALPLLERVAGRGPGWRRHVPAVAFGLVTVGLVVGLARPVLELSVPRERATVIVALDVSTSMRAVDVEPSRIDAATAAARTFVASLPDTFNVGLVTFSGTAAVAVAPTLDRTPVLAALQDPDLGDGTAIGDAVGSALAAVRSLDAALASTPEGPPPARVVLLSDGANTAGGPLDAAAAEAAAAGVPVSTIAYGTPAGVIDSGSRTLPVPVDPAALAELAASSGGAAYTAATGAELQEVYDDIGSSVGYRTEQREVTAWVLAAALLAALAAAVTSLRWFARLP
ncbi:VWA domain-containing protein [Pseudonocardia humida]|uniref:VWA domain-containing protein n=1 Tax=Pseudonocardia humida TaxID=2800819 RepID=A0ABT0ZY65_9PSEU|nr:VWA domain-containing protein [Pseudonocardia humida]MCO1655666.1 VWA domain-containing protein [Pseudonocardia humida]